MRELASAPIILFSRQPDNQAVIEHWEAGGAVVRSNGRSIEVRFGAQHDELATADIPLTYNGRALHNVENTMAAIGACLGLGVSLREIAAGLQTFKSDPQHNSNRLNVFERGGVRIVFDYAHNLAGITALLGFGQELQREAGGRLLFVLGGPGDRTDDRIRAVGRAVGEVANMVFLHEEEQYLRGRPVGEITGLYREGVESAGVAPDQIQTFNGEVNALEAALSLVQPGDIVLMAAHAQRDQTLERLQRWADS
jgi:cyanophycin synthetase